MTRAARALAVAAALASGAAPAEGGFDRVDVLSPDSGDWLNYELPALGSYPLRPALRFVEQVKVVFELPWTGLYAGVSIASQSLALERPLGDVPGLAWSAGLDTRLLLPRGAYAQVAYRVGAFRFAVGVSARSQAAWTNLSWRSWDFLPAIGVGIGRAGP